MEFQLIVAVANLLLLVFKTVAYLLIRKSFLLLMVIDNLADMLFSLILCIPDGKYYKKNFSRKICCRLMQISQTIPVLLFISDLQKIFIVPKRVFVPYLLSILILVLQLLAKAFLYGFFRDKSFSKDSSDYLLLQDQLYDVLCTLPGLLSLLLIVSFKEDSEIVIDYVTSILLFALTVSFWERTLVKVDKPKFESLHPTFSKHVSSKQDISDLDVSPSNGRNRKEISLQRIEESADIKEENQNQRTPSPQFHKNSEEGEVGTVVEMV